MENKTGKRKKLTNLQKVMIALTNEAAKSMATAKKAASKKEKVLVESNLSATVREVEVQKDNDTFDSKSSSSRTIDLESNSSLVKRKLSESATAVTHNNESSKNLELVPNPIAKSTSSTIPKNNHAGTSQSMKVNIDYIRPPAVDKNVDTTNDDTNEYDDTCSVLSGILEEDICYTCGKSTINSEDWGSVVLCDGCNGEYHLQCAGLETIPESNFICYKCSKETNHFKEMDFSVSDFFPIPRNVKAPKDICYSPSRPLDAAWEECKRKGFMVVSELFSYEIMKVVESWEGAVKEIAKNVGGLASHDVVNRDGRYDMAIPKFLVKDLQLENILKPITDRLATIMGSPTPQLRTHNIIFAPVGSKAQHWHVDDAFDNKRIARHRYFTILIHLNPIDAFCGGTEIWSESMNRGDMIRARPGDALVFNGTMLHRGQGNVGRCHRFFYYASFACRADENTSQI
eukprot:gene26965-35669_t